MHLKCVKMYKATASVRAAGLKWSSLQRVQEEERKKLALPDVVILIFCNYSLHCKLLFRTYSSNAKDEGSG